MINRIREVRRSHGMTLKDVASRCKPETTAQTIGRLETGTRTLSLDWLNRIAEAIGVDSSELLFNEGEDESALPVVACLESGHAIPLKEKEKISSPRPYGAMVAMRISHSVGEYRSGDMLWLRQLHPDSYRDAINRDVLVPDNAGKFIFGNLIQNGGDELHILQYGERQRQHVVASPPWIGVADRLIRQL